MERLLSIFMYILWTVTIVAILCTTFTNFQHEDLNVIAGVLLFFSIINSVFAVLKKK